MRRPQPATWQTIGSRDLLLRRGPHAVASSTCSCSSCSSLPGGVSWLSSGSSPARWWWAASC